MPHSRSKKPWPLPKRRPSMETADAPVRHEIEAAAGRDLGQRDRPAEMLQAVEPAGIELVALRHGIRLQEIEAAVDAIGGDHHRLAVGQHARAQGRKAVVGGDEGVAGGSIGVRLDEARGRGIAAFEVGMTSAKLKSKRGNPAARRRAASPRPSLSRWQRGSWRGFLPVFGGSGDGPVRGERQGARRAPRTGRRAPTPPR